MSKQLEEVIRLSLPGDTRFPLLGPIWEVQDDGEYVQVEGARWHREGDRIIADYTREELELLYGMLEYSENGDTNGNGWWWLE